MPVGAWMRAAGCAAAAVLILAACGSDGGGDEAAPSETGETVSAAEWATATCTSLGDWVAGIQESLAALSPTADLEEAKQALAGFLDDAVERTDALASELAAAPAPDVEGGSEIVESLEVAFTDAGAALAEASEQVSELPTDDAAAADAEAQAIVAGADESIDEARGAIDALGEEFDDAELTDAFEGAEACQALIT